ncbi:hypothetical protein [Catellatospora vulcania]|uniref:hypothetical protein n=1 Tax=Catellatospora vulcania TaxID=1460450 RepID=UPI0012D3C78F
MFAPTLGDVVTGFLHVGAEHRAWSRLLAWQGLTGGGEDDPADDTYFTAMVDDVRRRQAAGELADDLDPAYVLLTLFAAAMAPTLLPQIARRITGRAADSPEFLDEYAVQLRRIVEHLAR